MDKYSHTEEHNGRIAPLTMETSQDVEKATKKLQIKILKPTFLQQRTLLEKYLLFLVALLFILCMIFMIIALSQTNMDNEDAPNVCLTEHCVQTAASLLTAIDHTADPCEDFFQYACGTWNNKHTIPEDKSSTSTFEVLSDDLQKILKTILEEPFNLLDNAATIKAKTLYQSCINTSHIEDVGDIPLRQAIQDLGGWPVTNQNLNPNFGSLEELLGKIRQQCDVSIIFEQWVGPDDMNSSVNIIQLDQASLGLPSRDYFLKGTKTKDLQAYHRLMTEIAVLLSADRGYAATEMDKVLHFEIQLSNATIPESDRHDTGEMYKKIKLKELQQEVPQINWLKYLKTFILDKITEDETVVVYALPYLKLMGKIIGETRREIIINYALWRFVLNMLPQMGSEYLEKRAQFRKVLFGVSAQRMRWNHCVDYVNENLGMAVGALFIRENFNHESKEVALEMIANIREAFNELIDENNWMDDETRRVAKQKANAMNERIGYPELLTNDEELSKEYEGMIITDDEFLKNVFNIGKFETAKNMKKLRQPVNKDRWTTDPAIVNAFYGPNKNDIVFPAGILQPLFYSKNFPKSLNYGGIGVVIGHEITHGFDDKGRQFDKDGNLKEWWNNATIKAFRERAQCIINQYSSYTLQEVGLQVNGKMTQGENIADNGGLKQAFRAYRKWVKVNGEELLLPGINLTHNQLFFLNYAQIWCGSMRPEEAVNKIRSSVHSPGPIRVLGPLSNSYDFAEAFKCSIDKRMNPNKKCSVW